jgi:sugar lactone lactonase YvrE
MNLAAPGLLTFFLLAATGAWIIPTQAAATINSSPSEFDAPSGLAFGGGHLWVTNEAGNSVTEISPSNGSWITTLRSTRDGFNRPTAIAASGPDLFIANAAGSVSELRASNGALVRVISGPRYHFVNPVAVEADGSMILVLNNGRGGTGGSITEIRIRTGTFIRTVSGSSYAFNRPAALAVSGPDIFVADKGNNSMTEVTSGGGLVRVVAQQGLSAPDGIAVQDGSVWVANSASNSATQIAEGTGAVVATETDSDGSYGFGSPLMVIGSAGNIFVASPFGASPMVTKLSATSGQPSWYMCNTNGPYYFSLLSAFALSSDGSDLWVASRSGANSETPGAATGSLTELSTGDGSLITTLPAASTSVPTTGTTTTTSPTSGTTTTTVP